MRTHISLTKIEILKKELGVLLPDVKSSHRVEAMARGLGWNTNAALRADLAEGPQIRELDEARFTAYLAEHGFTGIRNGVLAEAIGLANIAVARQAILAVMEQEPYLTPNGYPYSYKQMTKEERGAEFHRERASMVSDYHVAQFLMVQEFLLTMPRTKQVTRRFTSYGYKHQVEEFQKRKNAPDHYVSNGMFIVAALDMGFIVAPIEGTPNAFLNIGKPKPEKPEKPPRRSAILAAAANGPTWEPPHTPAQAPSLTQHKRVFIFWSIVASIPGAIWTPNARNPHSNGCRRNICVLRGASEDAAGRTASFGAARRGRDNGAEIRTDGFWTKS